MNTSAIVLSGGKGKRMKSDLPKPLHTLEGKTLLDWTLCKLDCLDLRSKVVVVGWRGPEIINNTSHRGIEWAIQPTQKGNADALGYGLSRIDKETDTVFVIQSDDSAFYRPETLIRFIESHEARNATVSLMTVEKVDKTPRFRVSSESAFYTGLTRLSLEERGVAPVEFFTGCACFDRGWLERRINQISPSDEGELSVSTLFEMARQEHERIFVHKINDPREWQGINTQDELVVVRNLFERKEFEPSGR